uniref:Uncharacterized protein n=1 Tax=Arundo donax TaxID=35708 RepID=A0A0A9HQH9_ARUDO
MLAHHVEEPRERDGNEVLPGEDEPHCCVTQELGFLLLAHAGIHGPFYVHGQHISLASVALLCLPFGDLFIYELVDHHLCIGQLLIAPNIEPPQ